MIDLSLGARIAGPLSLFHVAICALPGGMFGDGEEAPPTPPVAPVAPVGATPAPPPTQPFVAPSAPQLSEVQLRGRKVAEYAESCINRFSERASSSRQRYLSWCDAETGPTGNERIIYGLYTVSAATPCREAVTRALAMPPSMPEAEAAAERYAAALEQLQPLLVSAERYYDRESYRDDGMARGRELHPLLMDAFDAFKSADEALRGHVEQAEVAARTERLAQLEGDPAQRSRFLVEKALSDARAVMNLLSTLRIEERRLVSDNEAALNAAIDAFEQSANKISGHQAAPPDRMPEMGWGRFKSACEETLQAALDMKRRIRDGERLSATHLRWIGTSAGWMVDGSPDKLEDAYDDLVSAYNGMSW